MKREFKSEKRLKRIEEIIRTRQHSLRMVIENVHDPHNVSAIFRSCDAVGIPRVSLLYHIEQFPKLSRITSSSANKWVDKERFSSVDECYENLRGQGFKIYASMLDKKAIKLHEIDFTQKVAVVFGNEKRGVSEEAARLADDTFYIPMKGMVQSLNVSVAAAVTLYEALRQREAVGKYSQSELDEEVIQKMIDEWCKK